MPPYRSRLPPGTSGTPLSEQEPVVPVSVSAPSGGSACIPAGVRAHPGDGQYPYTGGRPPGDDGAPIRLGALRETGAR